MFSSVRDIAELDAKTRVYICATLFVIAYHCLKDWPCCSWKEKKEGVHKTRSALPSSSHRRGYPVGSDKRWKVGRNRAEQKQSTMRPIKLRVCFTGCKTAHIDALTSGEPVGSDCSWSRCRARTAAGVWWKSLMLSSSPTVTDSKAVLKVTAIYTDKPSWLPVNAVCPYLLSRKKIVRNDELSTLSTLSDIRKTTKTLN